ncbi:NAD(P)-dependent alcohol dehydrogenase [Exercitatus varius]|uniref:NAD(P)-dependent alcohol dehydrogenase n=1 Tax=Exercitatus varius TaxID=67857 RepID=UPI00294AB64E|nr:NAD(P)-dependent alcohol dehydrogenase [Exercitatus varius]MDG2941619.1 NAD(P)-dependent alcohol dehydrogenase [Exercitatus varius]
MTFTVKGYAAPAQGAQLVPFTFERRDLRNDDVAIEILYCGVCHSDLHHVNNDWGRSNYPVVPGHEIIGRVTAVGADVTKFKVGDTVGVGCLVDSCRHCESCKEDLEQYCEEGATLTYDDFDRHDGKLLFGGYSEQIVVSDRFVLRVPEGLDLKGAAPLLCAGITVWSPLRHWNVKAGSKVAVVGLGGLGHMALKLAKALGAEVTLVSRSKGKEEEAYRLGADHVLISKDEEAMNRAAKSFDLIINTVPYVHDINPYIATLKRDATLVMIGYLGELKPTVHSAPLVRFRQSIAGSLIGGLKETQELLDFCAEKGIVSDVEMVDIHTINDVYKRLEKGDVKYRFVIDMQSLKQGV